MAQLAGKTWVDGLKHGQREVVSAGASGLGRAISDRLIQHGAKIDAANRAGETALIVATQMRNTTMVRALLLAGADPDKTDSAAGLSARDYAARDNRSRQLLQIIESYKAKR